MTDAGKSGPDGAQPHGPRVMENGFDPQTLDPPVWPGARVAMALRLLHLFDDVLGFVMAYLLAYFIRFGFNTAPIRVVYGDMPLSGPSTATYAVHYGLGILWYLPAIGVPLLLLYALSGLYDGHMRLSRTPLMWGLLCSNATVLVALATWLYFAKNTYHMRGFLPLVLVLNVPLTWLARRTTNFFVKRMRNHNRLVYRTILIGSGPEAEKILERARKRKLKGHRIIARIPSPKTVQRASETLTKALAKHPAVSSVFVIDSKLNGDVCAALLYTIRRCNRAAVIFSPQFLKIRNPFEFGDSLFGVPLVHYAAPGHRFAPSRFRSAISKFAACMAIAALSPVMLLIGIAIRLETPGPALFVQERFGIGGRKFRMFKFRTMVADAEARLAALKSENETDGALFKIHDDPRLTRFGKFLRKTSLDELPQLLNIARGEMRFVGPRPLPCADMEPYLAYWQGFRQTVPAGLTCIWQCAGRSDIGFDAMAMLDIWYALNRSWLMDARILVRTVWSVIFGIGAC